MTNQPIEMLALLIGEALAIFLIRLNQYQSDENGKSIKKIHSCIDANEALLRDINEKIQALMEGMNDRNL